MDKSGIEGVHSLEEIGLEFLFLWEYINMYI